MKFLNNYPDSIIKDMNEEEKIIYVTNKLNDKITLDEIHNFLPYTSKDLKVIKEYAKIDKSFLEELANEWCEGKYLNKVPNISQLYNFEGTFA